MSRRYTLIAQTAGSRAAAPSRSSATSASGMSGRYVQPTSHRNDERARARARRSAGRSARAPRRPPPAAGSRAGTTTFLTSRPPLDDRAGGAGDRGGEEVPDEQPREQEDREGRDPVLRGSAGTRCRRRPGTAAGSASTTAKPSALFLYLTFSWVRDRQDEELPVRPDVADLLTEADACGDHPPAVAFNAHCTDAPVRGMDRNGTGAPGDRFGTTSRPSSSRYDARPMARGPLRGSAVATRRDAAPGLPHRDRPPHRRISSPLRGAGRRRRLDVRDQPHRPARPRAALPAGVRVGGLAPAGPRTCTRSGSAAGARGSSAGPARSTSSTRPTTAAAGARPVLVSLHDLTFVQPPRARRRGDAPLRHPARRARHRPGRDRARDQRLRRRRGPRALRAPAREGRARLPGRRGRARGRSRRRRARSRARPLRARARHDRAPQEPPALVHAFDAIAATIPDLALVVAGRDGWDRPAFEPPSRRPRA